VQQALAFEDADRAETGQFNGLSGTAGFHTLSAGAVFKGTLKGTLSG
jgi:hypothetical protein